MCGILKQPPQRRATHALQGLAYAARAAGRPLQVAALVWLGEDGLIGSAHLVTQSIHRFTRFRCIPPLPLTGFSR